MFSGIVEALGRMVEVRSEPPGCRLIVEEPKIAAETAVADSISVNGCCLTVVETDDAKMGLDRKSTRLNSSHIPLSRMPSSA